MNKKTLVRNLIISVVFSALLIYAVYLFLQYDQFFSSLVRNIILVCIAALFICIWWIFFVDFKAAKKQSESSSENAEDEDEDDDEGGYSYPDMVEYDPLPELTAEESNSQPEKPAEAVEVAESSSDADTAVVFMPDAAKQNPEPRSVSSPAQKEDLPEENEPDDSVPDIFSADGISEADPAMPEDIFAEVDDKTEEVHELSAPEKAEDTPKKKHGFFSFFHKAKPAKAEVPSAPDASEAAEPAKLEDDSSASGDNKPEAMESTKPAEAPVEQSSETDTAPGHTPVSVVDLNALTPEYISQLDSKEREELALRIYAEKHRRAIVRTQMEFYRTQDVNLRAAAEARRRAEEQDVVTRSEQERRVQEANRVARENAFRQSTQRIAKELDEQRAAAAAEAEETKQAQQEAARQAAEKEARRTAAEAEESKRLAAMDEAERQRSEDIRAKQNVIREESNRRMMEENAQRQAVRTAQMEAARHEAELRVQAEAIRQDEERRLYEEKLRQSAESDATREAESRSREAEMERDIELHTQERIANAARVGNDTNSYTAAIRLQMEAERYQRAEKERLAREVALRRKQEEAKRHLQELQQRRSSMEQTRREQRQRQMAEWASSTQQFTAITDEMLAAARGEQRDPNSEE